MQTSNLAALTQNSLKAARFGDSQDSWRWGIVTALSPVAVRLDGETSPIFPSDVLSKVTVGDRVLVRIAGMAATVMGSDGTQYQSIQVDMDAKRVVRPGVYPDGRLDPPAGLAGACRSGMVSISWPGKLSRLGGVPYLPPANFDHIVLQQSDTKTGDWTDIGMCTSGGLTLDRQDKVGSSLWFRGISVDIKGKRYEASQPFEVPISNQLAADVANAMNSADEAGRVAAKNQETLTSKLGEFQTTLDGFTSSIDTVTQDASKLHNEVASLREQLGNPKQANLLAGVPWVDGWSHGTKVSSSFQQNNSGAYYELQFNGTSTNENSPDVWAWTTEKFMEYGRAYMVLMPYDGIGFMPKSAVIYPFAADVHADGTVAMAAVPKIRPAFQPGAGFKKLPEMWWILDLTLASEDENFITRYSPGAKFSVGITTGGNGGIKKPLELYDVTSDLPRLKQLQKALEQAENAYRLAESKVDAAEVKTIVAESAGGGNHVVYSHGTPNRDGKSVGDTWFARDSKGTVWGQWVWDGTQWQPAMIDSKVIANLDVGKLTAGTVVTPEAVIEKLWADGLNSKVVETQKVVVSPGNLWTDTDFSAPGLEWQDLVRNKRAEVGDFYGRHAMHCIASAEKTSNVWRYSLSTPSRLGLISTLIMECEVLTTSDVEPQLRLNVQYSTDGRPSTLGRMSVPGVYVNKIESYMWCRVRCELPNLDQAYPLGFLDIIVSHSEDVYVSNVVVRAKNGTVLIEDGSITAGKLVVDESLIDKLTVSSSLWAGKISTEMLKVGDYVNGVAIDKYGVHIKGKGAGDVELSSGGFIARDTHGVPTVRIGTDGDAQFKGSIMAGSTISAPQIVGGVITGARLQTSQTGQRTVIWNDKIEQYDSGGNLFARIADEQISFWKNGSQIGRFDRGWASSSYGNDYGVGVTLEQPGQFISLGTHRSGSSTVDSRIRIDWSDVVIEGTRWSDVRNAAFSASNAQSQASSAMSQASNAMNQAISAMNQANYATRAVDDVQNRLSRLWNSAVALINAANSYGFMTADGGHIGPGHFPLPTW
ncbi:hypothetical protein [uncultured Mobiluncus sp.]|uniref:hypothetical protein n=1 Tax=uncultured Mobiluncus sp. TaxID=293425 RepID=UPI00262AF3B2|nr:hypothetical protein [uncultured Mobiluncus sp.]